MLVQSVLGICLVASTMCNVRNVTLLIYGMTAPFYVQALPYTGPGFDLAVRDVTKHYNGTINFNLQYVVKTGVDACVDYIANFDAVFRYYYTQMDRTAPVVLIYAGCDPSTTFADFGREVDILSLSVGTSFSNLRDRTRFPTSVALGGVQYKSYGIMVQSVLNEYNWTSVAFIYDTSGKIPFNTIVFNQIQNFLREFSHEVQLTPFPVEVRDGINFRAKIKEVSLSNRIIFLSVIPKTAQQFMSTAQEMSVHNGDYVWIYVDFPQNPLGEVSLNVSLEITQNREWLGSLLMLSTCYFHEEDVSALLDEIQSRALDIYNATFNANAGVPENSLHAYASIMTLAKVLNEQPALASVSQIASAYLNRTFQVPKVGRLYVDEMGERQNYMCLNQFNMFSRKFEMVRYYDGATQTMKSVNTSTLAWFTEDGLPPENEPRCGFKGDRAVCSAQETSVTSMILGVSFALLGTVGIAFALLWRWHTRFEFQPENWKLDPEKLCLEQCFNNYSLSALISKTDILV